MEGAAVASRLQELRAAISSCDEEISKSEQDLEDRRQQLREHSLAAEEAHMATIAQKESHFAEEWEADRGLTAVFTQRAHDTCIQSLLKRQDAVLEPEFYAHREQLLESASASLERTTSALQAQQRQELLELAASEEGQFEKRVKRAVHAHEENMRRLDTHQDE